MIFLLSVLLSQPVDYPIVYVKAPRYGDDTATTWPEVKAPALCEPGTDLVILNPDGTERVLVDAGDKGAAIDPYPTFDGKHVLYAFCPDVTNINVQRSWVPRPGWDIYRVEVATGKTTRLTHQEWTPARGCGTWSENHLSPVPSGTNYLGYGIANLGPCPIPGDRIAFTSSRNGYLPNKNFTNPNLQLFLMRSDGSEVEETGYLNLGSALHPAVLTDGRIMWSSYESQGLRDIRAWGLWYSNPDGTNWGPLFSAFQKPFSEHFQTQLTDGRIVICEYYNFNNWGFGTFFAFPAMPPDPKKPPFGPWRATAEILKKIGGQSIYYPFAPQGLTPLTPFCSAEDSASPKDENGNYVGKVTHPAGAPGNDLLLVWSPGPVNILNRPEKRPFPDGGIYLMRDGLPVSHPSELVLIKNDPEWNEQQPRALVPYSEIYGKEEPDERPIHERHGSLPAGTPFGLVGTSSLVNRNSAPGSPTWNWFRQGSDAGVYKNSEIDKVRIVTFEPTPHRSYGPNPYRDHTQGERTWDNDVVNERLKILGEITPESDTSFLAKVPADVSFTFHLIDENGLVLANSQTWHQVRPGERKADCGGCHAHNELPVAFESTTAGRPGFEPTDLTGPATTVEYNRDIVPILVGNCLPCHDKASQDPPGGLVLNDGERTYSLLKERAQPLRARESLLLWKLHGRRMDGIDGTIPGQRMPLGRDPLTKRELRQIATWVDLGMPISRQEKFGWFHDATNPTVNIELAGDTLYVGLYDGAGIESFSVSVNDQDVTDQGRLIDHVWRMAFTESTAKVTAMVEDQTGNVSRLTRIVNRQDDDDPDDPDDPDDGKNVKDLLKEAIKILQEVLRRIDE